MARGNTQDQWKRKHKKARDSRKWDRDRVEWK